jgi:hypothetical protein
MRVVRLTRGNMESENSWSDGYLVESLGISGITMISGDEHHWY